MASTEKYSIQSGSCSIATSWVGFSRRKGGLWGSRLFVSQVVV